MAAGGFVNVARFTAVSSGLGDFVVSALVTGYLTPAGADAANGTTYSYRAESADLSEWEIGEGVYTAGTTTLARTTIHKSSNSNNKVNFTQAPQVAIVALAGDLLLKANNLSDVASAATAFGNIKQAATASATGVVKRPTMAIICDQKTQNTAGGTFTSGADRTRDLNTEVSDPDGIVSISSNQFTLQAGTWLIKWYAPAYFVARHQSFLYNATDATEVARGSSAFSTASGAGDPTLSVGSAIVTIASAKAFEIRHRCETTSATSGFGLAANFGAEIYTRVEIFSYNQ